MNAPATLEALKKEIATLGPVPRHVAIIMDGNGRWARERGQPRIFGHQAGRKSVRECVEGSRELGIQVLTLYTFSVENWQRPEAEVRALMGFLENTLREEREEREELKENGVRLGVIGRREAGRRRDAEMTERHIAGIDDLVKKMEAEVMVGAIRDSEGIQRFRSSKSIFAARQN